MTREKQEDPNLEQIPLVQDRLEAHAKHLF